ncbi:PhoX family protein [Sphingomonas sp. Leaf10]|uniref:PhoX family protein n=1 Tax=Sphingomonas sp. Leaf10 TaxID=1735676 RepID=UPI0006FC7BC2|nr:PhoX family phosphatase [Sphingomonas sp. Leaf10]KQM33122.1 phosphatase [Sphingomonas sp. Leaf10]
MANSDLIIDYDDGDIETNPSTGPSLQDLVDQRYSRRQALRGGASTAAVAVFGGSLLAACDDKVQGIDNTPPVVGGTSSGATAGGRVVTLTGTATDDNAIVTQAFTQVSGPTVALSNANTGTATFIAPAVASNTNLVFRYAATDVKGATSTTDITVTVAPPSLNFQAVGRSLADTVVVPSGYTASVIYKLGDPLTAATPAFANDGTDSGYSNRAGDHHDGMSYFGLAASGNTRDANNSTRGLLVMNHENITRTYLHPNGPTTTNGVRPTAEVVKEIECHGVSVVEVTRASTGGWSYVQSSALNRRITPFTPTTISGPVRGNALLFTAYSPDGTNGRGTINNCANGHMPWGTYMTCEENWAGYYRRDAGDNARRSAALGAKSVQAFARYGLNTSSGDTLRAGNHSWTTAAEVTAGQTLIRKFNATVDPTQPANGTGDFRNEPNQYGWCVEIDPYDPTSTPRKRTALGRMNHEGCCPGRVIAGVKPAFYMGDDAQNEYIFKFVSNTAWVAADATQSNRLAIGDKYLDNGTLYVAKFNADGSGEWIALVFGQNGLTPANTLYSFADQADVLTHCRLAGDAVGATRMDRPEWTAVNPATGEMYCTLTNNSSRTPANVDAANPRSYIDPQTNGFRSTGNANGHIVRLREAGDTTEATRFTWDVYAFGSGADLDATNINLSGLDATNDFSSPDGLWFSAPTNAAGQVTPVLWIQTDDGAYTDVTNCMMLAAMPGTVGDGGTRTITNTGVSATSTVTTRVGKAPGTTMRRFLVGPVDCEITGIESTPDGRSLFVNIQHPGEGGRFDAPTSNWPPVATGATAANGALTKGTRPRSATVVITKDDGGVIAL